jgi:hypothetical protein
MSPFGSLFSVLCSGLSSAFSPFSGSTTDINQGERMNSKMKSDRARLSLATRWREMFRRRRVHDPMLVFNMSIFNIGNGWDRTFNPLKAHENGTR